MAPKDDATDKPGYDDEIIIVKLPRADYDIMRDIIARQKSLNWLGRYVRNVLFVAAGGILTLFVFGDQIKKILTGWLGG